MSLPGFRPMQAPSLDLASGASRRRSRIVACASATVMTLACAATGQDAGGPARPTFRPPPETRRKPTFTILSLPETVSVSRVLEARQEGQVDGHGLAAAVLDTGLNVNHVDFAGEGRIPARHNFTGEDDGKADVVTDYLGHGSNVAGIIAAHGTGPGRGRHTGIAPGANVIPLKIMSQGGCEPDDIEKALDWVLAHRLEHQIRVVVASFGDGQNWATDDVRRLDRARAQDLDRFAGISRRIADLRNAGVAVVVGCGNSYEIYNNVDTDGPVQQGMQFPAIFRACVSVGAVYDGEYGPQTYDKPEFGKAAAQKTAQDQLAPFSQRLHPDVGGPCRTDIFAPMGRMYASGKDAWGPEGESIEEGTSQAAPVAAGAILLLQQYHKNKFQKFACITHIEQWLRDGARSIRDHADGNDNVKHTEAMFPRLDVLGALLALRATPCNHPMTP